MKTVYKATDKSQPSFLDFNQPLGMHMSPNNRWVRLAELIPWDEYEEVCGTLQELARECRQTLQDGAGSADHPETVELLGP